MDYQTLHDKREYWNTERANRRWNKEHKGLLVQKAPVEKTSKKVKKK